MILRYLNKKISILTSFFVSISIVLMYLFLPFSLQSTDGRLRDFMFLLRGEQKPLSPIIIVDINEKSLAKFGQFPWQRNLIANLLDNISKDNAYLIGLDITFAEEDKTSPSFFAKTYNLKGKFENFDEILANKIAKTPTILGYAFDFDNLHANSNPPNIPAVFIEKNFKKNNFLPEPKSLVQNIALLQNSAFSSGFYNNIPDPSGVIRSTPLLMKYDLEIYPSLAFEMFRIAYGYSNIYINYEQNGIENILLDKQIIKSDKFGRIFINFRGKHHTYKYISAADVLEKKVPNNTFKDSFVLIGTSAIGLLDLRTTPFESTMPGVEIHANILDNLLNQDYLHQLHFTELIDISIIILIAFLVGVGFMYLSPMLLVFAFTSMLLGLIFGYYYLMFEKHVILNLLYPLLSLFLSSISTVILGYILQKKQTENIKHKFSQKVSKSVMDELLKSNSQDIFATQEKQISIYFSDIRSFTSFSEKLDPPSLIKLLNQYMTPMTNIITNHDGTIDKFIGDAIMAYWNAPKSNTFHADHALLAAIEQVKQKKQLNKKLYDEFGIEIEFGIGINTGNAVVGEMGSIARSDYTIIGNSVNIASRLEGLCMHYGVNIIFSQYTKANLKQRYNILELDTIKVKGIQTKMKIYTILDDINFIENFHSVISEYQNAKFGKCLELLSNLDKMVLPKLQDIYTKRCNEFIKNPSINFDGVNVYTHK